MNAVKYFLIFILAAAFSGCSVGALDRKLGEVFFSEQATTTETVDGLSPIDAGTLTKEQKDKIEQWLVEQGLNRFGDAVDTWYENGTPLVTASGTVERYEYILGKHGELIDKLR